MFRNFLFVLILSAVSFVEGRDFSPPGLNVKVDRQESPLKSFRIVTFKNTEEEPDWQIWVVPLKKTNFKLQLLLKPGRCEGIPIGYITEELISPDETSIALNYRVGSNITELCVFHSGTNGSFHRVRMDLFKAAVERMMTQLNLKGQGDFGHAYCEGDEWLGDGLLLAHISGHSDGGIHYQIKDWQFIYDVKNDRFASDPKLDVSNLGAIKYLEPKERHQSIKAEPIPNVYKVK